MTCNAALQDYFATLRSRDNTPLYTDAIVFDNARIVHKQRKEPKAETLSSRWDCSGRHRRNSGTGIKGIDKPAVIVDCSPSHQLRRKSVQRSHSTSELPQVTRPGACRWESVHTGHKKSESLSPSRTSSSRQLPSLLENLPCEISPTGLDFPNLRDQLRRSKSFDIQKKGKDVPLSKPMRCTRLPHKRSTDVPAMVASRTA
eukprot:Nitzschia sp. Nitz4//scaffold184_size43902//30209//30811//NITZ4_007285-RA/size43902-processed-gene-0.7-mRNA-1//1//CDS//3329539660//1988//frame0